VDVLRNLLFLSEVVGPTLGEAVRLAGGIPLRPLMTRALHMGDELHSRNTAATLLFTRELFPPLLELAGRMKDEVRQTLDYLRSSDYFFLRLSMAASKATADAAAFSPRWLPRSPERGPFHSRRRPKQTLPLGRRAYYPAVMPARSARPSRRTVRRGGEPT